jgi:hypothetical protein
MSVSHPTLQILLPVIGGHGEVMYGNKDSSFGNNTFATCSRAQPRPTSKGILWRKRRSGYRSSSP